MIANGSLDMRHAPVAGIRGNPWLAFSAVLLLFFLHTGTVMAESSLRDVTYATLPGNQLQISLELDGEPETPSSFTIDEPARIAFDFANTRNRLAERNLPISEGLVEGVSTAEAGGRTRVVVRLATMMAYETELDGNTFNIYLRERGSETAGGQSGIPPTNAGETSGRTLSSATPRTGIEDIDFRRGDEGAGRILVELTDESTQVDLRRDGSRVVAHFHNARLPERLQRRLNVVDFATPVEHIETKQDGSDIRMVISPTGQYDYMGYQVGNVFTIEFAPITPADQERRALQDQQFTGERLSLNFQDIEVRSVLQLIGDFTDLNVVVSDSVSGNLTLRLQNVPWDQALDIILQTKKLDKRVVDNVMRIGTFDELAEYELRQQEAAKQIEEVAPLRSEHFQVNYAKAGEVANLLRSTDSSLLSERGNVAIDERTNTLIIRDTERSLSDIRSLLNKLDVPVRQVLIESRIVIANDDFSRELGVRFGASGRGDAGSDDDFIVGGTRSGGLVPGGTGFDTGGAEGLLVDLPASGAAGSVGLAVGRIGDRLLQLELSALESEGRGEIVSSPRVITANQNTASIMQGVKIPYQSRGDDGPVTVFEDAALALDVTPQITPDERVIMDILVSKDSVGEIFADGVSINTQSVTTQVLVDNGETVVLGGIYERDRIESVDRIPFFGSLPAVGWMFRSTRNRDNNSELLIFVTPRILEESLSASRND